MDQLRWSSIRNYSLLVLSLAAYFSLTYFAPKSDSDMNIKLSGLQTTILTVTLIGPYLLAWVLAVYSLTAFGKYAQLIKKAHDKRFMFFVGLNDGLIWIVVGLILPSLVTAVKPYFVASHASTAALTIVTNYLYIFPLLVGFAVIFKNVRKIRTSANLIATSSRSDTAIKFVLVALLTAAYSYLALTNTGRQFAVGASAATYYLPDFLIVTTIILPLSLTWWLGFSVSFALGDMVTVSTFPEIFKATRKILFGSYLIVFSSILLQTILSLGNSRLESLGLLVALAIVYLFVIMQGLGYLFLALGVRELNAFRSLKT